MTRAYEMIADTLLDLTYKATMKAAKAAKMPPTDATVLTPAPVKDAGELGVTAPVPEGETAVPAWTCPSEI